LLKGKRLVITGVLTEASIAFSVARAAQENGAEIVLTSYGRALSLTKRAARRLPEDTDVIELDACNHDDFVALRETLVERWGEVDGGVHAIGFAPQSCLGGHFLEAEWVDVATTLHVSAFSLKELVATLAVVAPESGASFVGLDFDGRQAWPHYDWMGVAKAGLEAVARYLAREVGSRGIRVNLVSAGPLRTMAARSIPNFADFDDVWASRAPLGWHVNDASPVASACVALLSDLFPMTTGEIVHVDGGFHAVGA
jgi:enoyl-[acyl-carrier protein] reductase I